MYPYKFTTISHCLCTMVVLLLRKNRGNNVYYHERNITLTDVKSIK